MLNLKIRFATAALALENFLEDFFLIQYSYTLKLSNWNEPLSQVLISYLHVVGHVNLSFV